MAMLRPLLEKPYQMEPMEPGWERKWFECSVEVPCDIEAEPGGGGRQDTLSVGRLGDTDHLSCIAHWEQFGCPGSQIFGEINVQSRI